jgi:hypothetical protein
MQIRATHRCGAANSTPSHPRSGRPAFLRSSLMQNMGNMLDRHCDNASRNAGAPRPATSGACGEPFFPGSAPPPSTRAANANPPKEAIAGNRLRVSSLDKKRKRKKAPSSCAELSGQLVLVGLECFQSVSSDKGNIRWCCRYRFESSFVSHAKVAGEARIVVRRVCTWLLIEWRSSVTGSVIADGHGLWYYVVGAHQAGSMKPRSWRVG